MTLSMLLQELISALEPELKLLLDLLVSEDVATVVGGTYVYGL